MQKAIPKTGPAGGDLIIILRQMQLESANKPEGLIPDNLDSKQHSTVRLIHICS